MGNTQSTEAEPSNRRHNVSHRRAGSAEGASGAAPTASGGLSHRLSRRTKTPGAGTTTSAAPVPVIQVSGGSADGQSQKQRQQQQHSYRNHAAGVGAMDMLTPVVGSPLPDSNMMIPGQGSMGRGGRSPVHIAVPEVIPQTLPKQGGLAQMMGARMIAPGVGGRSPRSGISEDLRLMGNAGMAIPRRRSSGLASSFSPNDDCVRAEKVVPTLIRWTEPGDIVYMSGSFIDWQYKIRLHENDGMFGVVVDLPVGTHCLKFIVDGKWRCSNRFIIAPDEDGNLVNYFKVEDVVEEQDQEKEDNVEGLDAAALSNSPPGEYGNAIPDLAKLARESTNSRRNEPPLLPPHLNQVLLNSSDISGDDPNILPVPNHVVLNHLYACSIKDNVMAVSSTSRYRGKYMTTVYYKPVTPLS
ncbi:hypothetical protein GGF37_000088 [Kickxella alabastrina]|nr:hypothetical protein GGF37_000088 [Kickxella alabastrina]